ncbi:MAG: DUF3177 family protein [Synechococcales cyanobacterium]
METASFWFTEWIWWDFRVAVVLTVVVPIGLLVWSYVTRHRPVQDLLIIYWKVASLLAITVYLMIGGIPVGFLSGAAARAAIPTALWFWPLLTLEISETPGLLSRLFLGWRWLVSVYMGVGLLFSLAFAPCAFQTPISAECRAWWDPPLAYRDIFHPTVSKELLGFVGVIGLSIYVLYSLYFLWRYGREQAKEKS